MLLLALACGLRVSPALAGEPPFAAVSPGHSVEWPRDTGAHPAFRTEWWYATGWIETPEHQPLGFQITFFRSATGHDANDPGAFAPTQLILAHAALSDPRLGRLVHDQKIARQGFGLAYAQTGNTDVRLDTWRMVRAADGHYDVDADAAGFALHLAFTPSQPPLLQGDHGYSRKGPLPEQASYYYSEPQLRVTGSITRPSADGASRAATPTPVTGSAWLDHEWSSTLLASDAVGWDWLGANLSDDAALMAFKVRGADGHAVWAHAALRSADGTVTQYGPGDVDFTPTRQWRSPRTGTQYPVATVVRTGDIRWQLTPLLDDQELDSRESAGALYWEGAVTIRRDGQPAGRGYLELTGYGKKLTLERR
jgi:predicted secreted hydrolase